MAKQTKQRSVKYPPKQGNLSRKEIRRAVREVVDASRPKRSKSSTTIPSQTPSKPRTPSKPKNTK